MQGWAALPGDVISRKCGAAHAVIVGSKIIEAVREALGDHRVGGPVA